MLNLICSHRKKEKATALRAFIIANLTQAGSNTPAIALFSHIGFVIKVQMRGSWWCSAFLLAAVISVSAADWSCVTQSDSVQEAWQSCPLQDEDKAGAVLFSPAASSVPALCHPPSLSSKQNPLYYPRFSLLTSISYDPIQSIDTSRTHRRLLIE